MRAGEKPRGEHQHGGGVEGALVQQWGDRQWLWRGESECGHSTAVSLFVCWDPNPKFQWWQVVALGGLESVGTDERASEGGLDGKSDNLKLLKRARKPPSTLGGRRSWVRAEEPLLCGLSQVNQFSRQYNTKVLTTMMWFLLSWTEIWTNQF